MQHESANWKRERVWPPETSKPNKTWRFQTLCDQMLELKRAIYLQKLPKKYSEQFLLKIAQKCPNIWATFVRKLSKIAQSGRKAFRFDIKSLLKYSIKFLSLKPIKLSRLGFGLGSFLV